MKAIAVLVALSASLAALPARAQQVLYLVRHAEKVDDSVDPPLAPRGKERAERLAAMLKQSGVAAIYASNLRRTIETAEPLARALGLPIVRVDGADVKGLVARVRKDARERVLVVGHQDTVPELLRAYGATNVDKAAAYEDLYVLFAGEKPAVAHLRY